MITFCSIVVGLDPAGFSYGHMPPEGRLDETDAQFVDVIHTATGSFGLEIPVGHVDIYPNGGNSNFGCEWENKKLSVWSKC